MPYLSFAALLLCAGPASATPGSVDRSFGSDGIAGGPLPDRYAIAAFTSVASQLDGSLTARLDRGEAGPALVEHFLADGRPDPAAPPELAPASKSTEALQEDGKLLVVGGCCPGSWLERTNTDGSPDLTFGTDGRSATVPFSIERIVPLPSGKILVAGRGVYAYQGKAQPIYEIFAARFESDGSLDPGFGAAGTVRLRTDFGIQTTDLRALLPREGEGALMALAWLTAGSEPEYSLIALTGAGSLDPSFGSGGSVNARGRIVGVRALGGGATLVAGDLAGDFSLARYTSGGQLDASFGQGGLSVADFGADAVAGSVLWLEDGSVLIGGATVQAPVGCSTFGTCPETPALARFTPTGQLNPSFGSGGLVILEGLTGDGNGAGRGVLSLDTLPGEGVVAAGGSGRLAFLAALTPSGALDPGFGSDGIVTESFPLASQTAVSSVAVDRGDRILIAGSTNAGSVSPVSLAAVVRYRADGSLDTSYGDGAGFVRIPGSDRDLIAIDRRGRAVLLGRESNLLIRLTPTGMVDSSFGEEGMVRIRLGAPSKHRAEFHALATLPDGKILVAGQVRLHGQPRLVVVRLRPDGRPDRSFGDRGEQVLAFRRRRGCGARRLAIEPDGRVLIAGYVRRHASSPFARRRPALVRLLPDGSLDRGFGRKGFAVAPPRLSGIATAIAIRRGRILVGAWVWRGERRADVLLRYRLRGGIDRRFGARGVARLPVGQGGEEMLAILPTAQRIVAVRDDLERPVVALHRDGRLDRRFGGGADLVPDRLSAVFITPGPVAALQAGKVVLAWTSKAVDGRMWFPRMQRLTNR